MATIHDVAKAVGVSVATVSRVLNNSPAVNIETREKVLFTIRKLNYQPNLLGRNLRRSKTKMILVIVPDISNPFYSSIVKGIEDVAHKNDYNVMLCNTNYDPERMNAYIELLKNRLSDGAVVMGLELGKLEFSDLAKRFPIVQCCEYIEGAGTSYVAIDDFSAAIKAVRHLVNLGHKRIGLITCKDRFISNVKREQGYKEAIKDAGIEADPELIMYVDSHGFKNGLRAVEKLIMMPKRPTAIFACSDLLAIGAMKGIKERGLQVPEDIAIVGFDNISFASVCNPPLTTIAQPQYDLGCTAMDILIKQIHETITVPQITHLEYELIIRESTVK